jgi:hypothetical protein
MRPQTIGSPLASNRSLSAILLTALWLSEMALAHPSIPTSTDKTPSRIIRRATGTGRSTGTVTANANTGKKGLSLVVIIVIVVAVLGEFYSGQRQCYLLWLSRRLTVLPNIVAFLAIAGVFYWLYRRRSKARKTKALNLPSIGQQYSRPISGSPSQVPGWWQPAADGAETIDSHDHIIVPYSQGGHGYTYGRTLDVPSAGVVAGTRTSVGHPPQVTAVEPGGPFQIPFSAPPPPPSISPSYHTYAEQGERSISNPRDLETIRSGHVYNPTPYTPPANPPGSFQPRPAETTLAYLQPQATGTSTYSSYNPYETSAMTRSTSGHPGI